MSCEIQYWLSSGTHAREAIGMIGAGLRIPPSSLASPRRICRFLGVCVMLMTL
jgi:hypothetical protein